MIRSACRTIELRKIVSSACAQRRTKCVIGVHGPVIKSSVLGEARPGIAVVGAMTVSGTNGELADDVLDASVNNVYLFGRSESLIYDAKKQ